MVQRLRGVLGLTAAEFEIAKPIVEGYLYAYAHIVKVYPGAVTSSAFTRLQEYKGCPPDLHGGERASQQERWVEAHDRDIQIEKHVKAVLYRLAARDMLRHEEGVDKLRWWRLVWLHYAERWPWPKVAVRMNVSTPTVYRWKDRLLQELAYEFDLVIDEIEKTSHLPVC